MGEGWTLMKAGKPSVPTINSFLAERLPKEARVGIDPFVHSVTFVNGLKKVGAFQAALVRITQRMGQL